MGQKHDPNKWRRLGFVTENPEPDFEEMGFLGMMDLSDYVRKHADEFQNILAEQELLPTEKRCPIAQTSLTVTAVLFEHFEVDSTEVSEDKTHMLLESRSNFEKIFKPLLLHWSRLHVATLHAFLRLWKETGADAADFQKITELVRILVESVVGGAQRTRSIEYIEQELAGYERKRLRALQMELLDLAYDDAWGQHLRGTKDELQSEALQFVKEQRVRCLLSGAWFPYSMSMREHESGGPVQESDLEEEHMQAFRYIRLSSDRKNLHWNDFEELSDEAPPQHMLLNTVPLSSVSSVLSNITANEEMKGTAHEQQLAASERFTTTKITIFGYEPRARPGTTTSKSKSHGRTGSKASSRANQKEIVLLSFIPQNHIIASEWLDGLLMLLDQQPITAETNKMIKMISNMGLKVRLLNVRGNDEDGIIEGIDGIEPPPVPSRDGLDEDYFYEI